MKSMLTFGSVLPLPHHPEAVLTIQSGSPSCLFTPTREWTVPSALMALLNLIQPMQDQAWHSWLSHSSLEATYHTFISGIHCSIRHGSDYLSLNLLVICNAEGTANRGLHYLLIMFWSVSSNDITQSWHHEV